MRQCLLILCGLAFSVSALAVESDPCKRNREILLADKTQSGIHDFKLSGGGAGGAAEVELVDNTNLAPSCSKTNPSKVTGVTIDKVSCFAD